MEKYITAGDANSGTSAGREERLITSIEKEGDQKSDRTVVYFTQHRCSSFLALSFWVVFVEKTKEMMKTQTEKIFFIKRKIFFQILLDNNRTISYIGL